MGNSLMGNTVMANRLMRNTPLIRHTLRRLSRRLNHPLNRLHSRGGYSLVELLVVMTIMSALLGVVVTLLTTLLHEHRAASRQRETQTSLARFAEQFRADVHASESVEREESSASESPSPPARIV